MSNSIDLQKSNLPEDIQIRQFISDDRPLVEHFFDQMGGETRAFFDRNRGNYHNAMKYFEGTSVNTVFFLAECSGVMIGYVFLWDMDRAVPWLGIAVHEGYKGKGLGGMLMRFAIGYARDAGKGGVLLTTHVANLRGQALYEKTGFERMGIHTSGEILYFLRF
jgi:ribosomal protein S18 acetylase RimI-like enzyme